MTTDKYERIG